MFSPDDRLIEDALRLFSKELNSALPLRHFGEFHDLDEKQLNEAIEQRRMIVFENVFAKIWNRDKEEIVSLLMKLNVRMRNEVIAEWTKKNSEHQVQSVSFLQKRVEVICDDFNVSLEAQLALNPDVEQESFKNYINRRKLFATSWFEGMWKPKNSKIVDERKAKLEKHLNSMVEEMLERQKLHLERKAIEEGNDVFQEVTKIVLERSRQLKSYVDNHQGKVSIPILNGMVGDIKEYLVNGKGCALKESNEEIYCKLMETLDGEIKFLDEEESVSPEDYVKWAEGFDRKLKSDCFDRVEVDKVDEPDSSMRAQWITMQQILQEETSDFRVPEEPEPDQRNVKSDPSSRNKRAHVSDAVYVSVAKRRSSLRLASSKKDRISNDCPKITAASTPQVFSRPKRPKTGKGLPKKSAVDLSPPDTAEVSATSANVISKRKHGGSRDEERAVTNKDHRPPFLCNVCKRTFRHRFHFLKFHGEFCGVRVDKPFACKECGSRFSGKSHLEEHLRIHTGEKPFKCPKCMARFSRKQHLSRHLLSHARGASFICKACNLSFVSRSGLHHHNLTHLGKLPHACSHCDKRFQYMNKLKLHMVVHSDERPFKCSTCEASFASKRALSLHLQDRHGQAKDVALKLANQAAAAYLTKETNKSYSGVPYTKINSLVIAHVIRKAKLQLPDEIAEKTAGVSGD